MIRAWVGHSVVAALLVLAPSAGVGAEPTPKSADEKTLGWFNATDLSIVVTVGNSDTETLGFKNTLRRVWKRASFRLKLDAVKSDTADDRILLVDPGVEWEPGETPVIENATVVDPPIEPDVAKYFAEARMSRQIVERFMWHAGASWDRNEDAGILNRTILFAGLGHNWRDKDEFKFATEYGLSYTYREEETEDPLKDDRFPGARLSWDYRDQLGKFAVLENDLTGNVSLLDLADYNLDMTTAVSSKMSKHVALKISLQWLYSNEPALEDVDVIARVNVIDPDGVPGNGDEFFRTVSSGGAEIEVGESPTRKDGLDTVFRTSLVIDF